MSIKTMDEADHPAEERVHALTAWIRTWNDSCQQSERAPPRKTLSDAQRDHVDRLFTLIAGDLQRLAASPNHRWHGATLQDRVLVLFECLVVELGEKQYTLPADDGVRSLLSTIAKRRSIDLFREHRRQIGREVDLGDGNPPEATTLSHDEDTSFQHYEERVIQAAREYWESLPQLDGEIMRLRHNASTDRLRTFASIAARLGPMHKPDTVRKTYHRTLEQTREHLRRLGLLDDKGAR